MDHIPAWIFSKQDLPQMVLFLFWPVSSLTQQLRDPERHFLHLSDEP